MSGRDGSRLGNFDPNLDSNSSKVLVSLDLEVFVQLIIEVGTRGNDWIPEFGILGLGGAPSHVCVFMHALATRPIVTEAKVPSTLSERFLLGSINGNYDAQQ